MTEIIEGAQIEEVLDAIPLAVLAQDFDGNTILWNPAAERIFGWSAQEALGRLAGGVAHDFNNLLTAISGFAELALLHLDDDHPAAIELSGVVGAAERASGVAGQLLAFGRRQLVSSQPMDLNAAVQDSL